MHTIIIDENGEGFVIQKIGIGKVYEDPEVAELALIVNKEANVDVAEFVKAKMSQLPTVFERLRRLAEDEIDDDDVIDNINILAMDFEEAYELVSGEEFAMIQLLKSIGMERYPYCLKEHDNVLSSDEAFILGQIIGEGA